MSVVRRWSDVRGGRPGSGTSFESLATYQSKIVSCDLKGEAEAIFSYCELAAGWCFTRQSRAYRSPYANSVNLGKPMRANEPVWTGTPATPATISVTM